MKKWKIKALTEETGAEKVTRMVYLVSPGDVKDDYASMYMHINDEEFRWCRERIGKIVTFQFVDT
jgi:hypothetical protein